MSLVKALEGYEQLSHILQITQNVKDNLCNHNLIDSNSFSNVINLDQLEKLIESAETNLIAKLKEIKDTLSYECFAKGIRIKNDKIANLCMDKGFTSNWEDTEYFDVDALATSGAIAAIIEIIKTSVDTPYDPKVAASLLYLNLITAEGTAQQTGIHSKCSLIPRLTELMIRKNIRYQDNAIDIFSEIAIKSIEERDNLLEQDILDRLIETTSIHNDVEIQEAIERTLSEIISHYEHNIPKNEYIPKIAKMLNLLLVYPDKKILNNVLYEYLFVLQQTPTYIDIFDGNIDDKLLKEEMEEKSNNDKLLINGWIRQCQENIFNVNIPIIINILILKYYTLFYNYNKQKIAKIKTNPLEIIVDLLKYRNDTAANVLSWAINRGKNIYGFMEKLFDYGLTSNLKYFIEHSNDNKCMILWNNIIEYGEKKDIEYIAKIPLFVKCLSNITIGRDTKISDHGFGDVIIKGFDVMLRVYQNQYGATYTILYRQQVIGLKHELQALLLNDKIIEKNREFIDTLIVRIK